MDKSLLEVLVDPISKTPLQLEVHKFDRDGNIFEWNEHIMGT